MKQLNDNPFDINWTTCDKAGPINYLENVITLSLEVKL